MTFEELQRNALAEWNDLENSEIPRIYISTATCGRSSGALQVLEQLNTELQRKNIKAHVFEVGCIGSCYLEPLIYIAKHGRPRICYSRVTPAIVTQLVTDYLINDNPRPDLALCSMGEGEIEGISHISKLPMFEPQVRIALRNCGYIDPENINHYIANGGYSGLDRALKMTPGEVIEEVRRSGLRGRGSEGFPTGTKWSLCRDAFGSEKYLVCNAVDCDPAAYPIRSLLEGDPHSVLEGMLIAAYAIGANYGYIFIDAQNTLSISRVKTALMQMESNGLLGKNILDSGFSFQLELKTGAYSFIYVEETALLRALEGRRPMPSPHPSWSVSAGLEGKPTVINNAETLASVSAILQKNADWYAGYGTERSKGTKIFTLAGKLAHTGFIEIPMGIPLSQIINDIGGGIPDNKGLKGALVGGPSGGFLSAGALNNPVDYENLASAGALIGSGGIIVADNDTCIVDMAKNCISFIQAASCGKCVLCREGTMQMFEILTDITEGRGKTDDLDLLFQLGEVLKASFPDCALGQTAPNPVLTTIQHFRTENLAHIKRKSCPAKVCPKYISFYIIPEKCQGCLACIEHCPTGAITGNKKMIHVIDQEKCIKCGICFDVCSSQYEAVAKASGILPKTPDEPIPVGSWVESR